MSETIETGNQHQNTPSADDLSAQIAADEAARAAPIETTPEPKAEEVAAPKSTETVETEEVEDNEHSKRIEQLAFERREARRRVRELEERIARMEQPNASTEETEDQRVERRAQQMAAAELYKEKANGIYKAGVKEFPDFEQRMGPLREIGLTPAFVEAADEVGDTHKLLHYLGRNIDEAERIMALPPHKMGAALGKIAQKIAPPPKQTSKAPAPIKPIGGTGNGAARVDETAENMSDDQLARYMKQEDERWYSRRR